MVGVWWGVGRGKLKGREFELGGCAFGEKADQVTGETIEAQSHEGRACDGVGGVSEDHLFVLVRDDLGIGKEDELVVPHGEKLVVMGLGDSSEESGGDRGLLSHESGGCVGGIEIDGAQTKGLVNTGSAAGDENLILEGNHDERRWDERA
jgi:hypothetical protein